MKPENSDYKTKREILMELHNDMFIQCRDIMIAKNADYSGSSGDPFSNFRIAEVFGMHPVDGIILRTTDKLQRIKSYISKGKLEVRNEGFEDACRDIINYMILIMGIINDDLLKKSQSQP